ncbi:MAG: epoxyqueuosine reductase QueH [Oscillospiraceae bacterium]|nr:epoxyqueuosine reductase QueH [Oscillospiraceae bacterium]
MVFNETLKKIANYVEKPKLLLHSCCAPCSSYVISVLTEICDVCVFYFNPNISPVLEYEKRYSEQIRLLNILNIKHIETRYEPREFHNAVCGLESEPEGARRCDVCFKLRLSETATVAKENGFDFFGTTLTVSPHKNAEKINAIMKQIGEHKKINPLSADFKKKDGYKKSIELSKKHALYRQNYCGCRMAVDS